MKNLLLPLLVLLLLAACGRGGNSDVESFADTLYSPRHASGFAILGASDSESVLVESRSPWQGADSATISRLLILRGGQSAPEGFSGQKIEGEARRIVCMSSTQIAMLDALNALDRVVGVSGLRFISNPKIQAGKDTIADVGYDSAIDYELLLSVNPDLVMLYGVDGSHPMEPKLRELAIPFIYVGEYLEESPLGKAEWMVPVGEIIGKREEAEKIYAKIPERYDSLRTLARNMPRKPKVMLNTPYNDSWVMPSVKSYGVTLITDAGGEYLYPQNTSSSSVPVDLEQAYLLMNRADAWINLGQYDSAADIIRALPKFADTKPVVSGNLWNNNLRSTPGGGNDYWEGGIVHPDLILRDLIKIFHPSALPGEPFVYYKKL